MCPTRSREGAPQSLVNPDLSNLWSHATLQRPPGPAGTASYTARTQAAILDACLKCYGGFVLLCLSSSWVAGAALPFLAVYLGSRDSPISRRVAAALLVVLVAPYTSLFKNLASPWRAASRFWLSASYWFEGGATLAYESEPDKDDVPCMMGGCDGVCVESLCPGSKRPSPLPPPQLPPPPFPRRLPSSRYFHPGFDPQHKPPCRRSRGGRPP